MKKEIELLLKDPYINDLVRKNNLSESFVEQNFGKLLRVAKSRSLCNGCNGLYCCSQASPGERLDLSYDAGVLLDEVEYCDYALNKLRKQNL